MIFNVARAKLQKLLSPIKKHNEPVAENIPCPSYFGHISNSDVEYGSNSDDGWFTLKSLSPQSSHKIPTWAAYNSLLTDAKPKTTVQQLPIVNGRPTSSENLLCAIKEAGKVKNVIQPARKSIISFDLQLYAKAIQLQVKPDITNDFVFRMGELHIVFTNLKVLGKLTDGSGLDQAFEEAGKLVTFHQSPFFSKTLYFRTY